MPDEIQLSYLRWLAAEDEAEAKWTSTLRDYYSGKHPTYLTTRQQEFIGLWAQQSDYIFSDNYCALVVDIPAERLQVTGLTGEADAGAAQAQLQWDWWQANRFDSYQDDLYMAALRDGEAYVIVSFDNEAGRPRWDVNYKYALEDAVNGYGVKLHRHPDTGEAMFASKRWTEFDENDPAKIKKRLTLYYQDRVEKYRLAEQFDGKQWQEAGWAPIDEDPWPIPWTDGQGQPLGLPVIAFTNPGGPEINIIYSLQDVLNKTLLDLISSADFAGFPIFTATGVSTSSDELAVAPGRMLRSSNPDAEFDRIESEGFEGLLDTLAFTVQEIAGKARVPQYLFQRWGAEPPSGESLKSQEVGLLSKTGRKQKDFGASWDDVFGLSARVDKTFNRSSQADPAVQVQAVWQRAEIRSMEERIQEAEAKRAAGVPEERILVEVWEYSADDARRFVQAAAARRNQAVGQAVLGFLEGQQGNAGA